MDNTAIHCGCLFTKLLNIRAYYNENKLNRTSGKIEADGEAWLLYDPHKRRKLKEAGGHK
jgi:hypothetical protein